MVRLNQIEIGCRVEGCHGPLVANPDPTKKRRVRSRVVGTVRRAEGTHSWTVVFDFDQATKVVKSSSLKVVPADTGVPVDELTSNAVDELRSGVVDPAVEDGSTDTTVSVVSTVVEGREATVATVLSPDVPRVSPSSTVQSESVSNGLLLFYIFVRYITNYLLFLRLYRQTIVILQRMMQLKRMKMCMRIMVQRQIMISVLMRMISCILEIM